MFIERLSLLTLVFFSTVIAQFFDDMSYPELDFASSYFNDDTDPYEQDFSESDSIVEDDEDDKQGWTVVSEEEVADLVGRIEAAERHEQFAMDADHLSTIVPATTEEFGTDTGEELESKEKEEGAEVERTTTPLQTVASLFSHLFSTSPSTDGEILEASRADANEPESQNDEGMNLNSETELQKEEKLTEASTTEEATETSKPEELIKESEEETSKFTEPAAKAEQKSLELDKETSDAETKITTSVEEVPNIETEGPKPIEITPESDAEVENVDGKSVEMEIESPKSEEFSSAVETKQPQLLEETTKKESTFPKEDNSQIMTDIPYSTTSMQEIESKTPIVEDSTSSSLRAAVPSAEKETEENEMEASASEEANSKSKTNSQEIVEPQKEDKTKILKHEETEPVPEVTETENKIDLQSEKESSKISEVTEETEKEVQRLTPEPTQETTVDTEILMSKETNTESREPVHEDLIVTSKAATVNNDELATQTQTTEENTQSLQTEEASQKTTEELGSAYPESL